MKRIFSPELWEQYVEKVEDDFTLKTYPQFDPYFNFPLEKQRLNKLLSSPDSSGIAHHDFLPFLKVLQKTPRYRWQEDPQISAGGRYDLETKIRPISFASHFDTYIYGFYSYALNQVYQEYIERNGFDEVVLAYRSNLDGKCNIQFAKEAFDEVKALYSSLGSCSVIALDIKGYFDHIDHSILKKMWCRVIDEDDLPLDQYKVFRSLTKYSYVNHDSFLKHFEISLRKIEKEQKKKYLNRKRVPKGYQSLLDLIPNGIAGGKFKEKMDLLRRRKLVTVNSTYDKNSKKRVLKKSGIPQGSAMSAVLSNIYLADFDKTVFEKGQKEGFVYRRYCDDLLIICDPNRVNKLKNYIIKLISDDCHLIIQDKKTDVIDFKENKTGKIRSFRREYDEKSEEFHSVSNNEKHYRNLQYLGFEYNGQNIYIRPSSLSRFFRKMKARVVKSVMMAYSKNSKSDSTIFKQQIYSRYSHLGKRNFITYATNASKKYYKNAADEWKEGMDSPSIKRQISAHMSILKQEIEKTSQQRAKQKGAKKVRV